MENHRSGPISAVPSPLSYRSKPMTLCCCDSSSTSPPPNPESPPSEFPLLSDPLNPPDPSSFFLDLIIDVLHRIVLSTLVVFSLTGQSAHSGTRNNSTNLSPAPLSPSPPVKPTPPLIPFLASPVATVGGETLANLTRLNKLMGLAQLVEILQIVCYYVGELGLTQEGEIVGFWLQNNPKSKSQRLSSRYRSSSFLGQELRSPKRSRTSTQTSSISGMERSLLPYFPIGKNTTTARPLYKKDDPYSVLIPKENSNTCIVLSSCVAVFTEPGEAIGFALPRFGDKEWYSTSPFNQFKVTISQHSDHVVKVVLMHLKLVSFPL